MTMDYKKAIDLLSMIEFENAECNLGTWYHGIDGDMEEALNMAIKTLELTQTGLLKDCESCRAELPCTDVISRQAALDCLKATKLKKFDFILQAREEIKKLPPASTEKTGYWIDDEFGSKCSCCGIHTHLDKFDRPMKFKHCSMCGAKMQEVEEC